MVKSILGGACALFIGCATGTAITEKIEDNRTAGYPSKRMYPWLMGGKSKTKLYRKEDNLYQAPLCGGCKIPIWTPN